jgi:queuine tRNA-ribosyltransferase
MGVGDPVSVVEAVALGVDMFDCVLPTRLARHGAALTSAGRLQVRGAALLADDGPVDRECGCPVCRRYARAYLRHLFAVGEPTAARLLTLHNLTWMMALMAAIRSAVVDGRLGALQREVKGVWARGGS